MDLPTAETQDDPPRVNTAGNYPMSGRQILMVESEPVFALTTKLKKKPSATGFFKQSRHNMFILQKAMT